MAETAPGADQTAPGVRQPPGRPPKGMVWDGAGAWLPGGIDQPDRLQRAKCAAPTNGMPRAKRPRARRGTPNEQGGAPDEQGGALKTCLWPKCYVQCEKLLGPMHPPGPNAPVGRSVPPAPGRVTAVLARLAQSSSDTMATLTRWASAKGEDPETGEGGLHGAVRRLLSDSARVLEAELLLGLPANNPMACYY